MLVCLINIYSFVRVWSGFKPVELPSPQFCDSLLEINSHLCSSIQLGLNLQVWVYLLSNWGGYQFTFTNIVIISSTSSNYIAWCALYSAAHLCAILWIIVARRKGECSSIEWKGKRDGSWRRPFYAIEWKRRKGRVFFNTHKNGNSGERRGRFIW